MQESTKNMYNFYLNNYPKLDFNKPRETTEYLLQKKSKRGKELSISTIKTILSAIVYKLKQSKHPNEDILHEYSKYIRELRKMTKQEEQDSNKIHGTIPDWNDIIKVRNELKNDDKIDKEYLILSLYTYLPPRRLLDFVLLKLASNKSYVIKDHNYNYYDMKAHKFIYNKFKTAGKYKQQIIDCPLELHKIIMNYVEKHNIKNLDLILGLRNYHQLLYIIKTILPNTGIDNIRHSYVNNELGGMQMSGSSSIIENAKKMGHSVETHLLYRKNV